MSIITITKDNFQREVMSSRKPVLMDFWAPWCGPCKMLSPVVEEIAEEADHVKVGKVNIDEQPELAEWFGVMTIPTLILREQGRSAWNTVGLKPKGELMKLLSQ